MVGNDAILNGGNMLPIIYIPQPNNKVAYKKSSYEMKPIGITIHNTANIASARSEINYMHESDDYRSFHFAVDDKEIIQGMQTTKNTWHSGDGNTGLGNRQTISIEICLSYVSEYHLHADEAEREKYWKDNYKKRFEKAQENAAELTAYLLKIHGWGFDPSRIYKHADFQNKFCPHRTLSEYGWGYFLCLVEKFYSEMEMNEPMTNDERIAFENLEKRVAALEEIKGVINDKIKDIEISTKILYRKYDDIPNGHWSKETIKKMLDKGILIGDEKGNINITNALARIFVILDRANIF